MQFGTYLASILMHISVVLIALLIPSAPPIKLDKVVYQVSLVEGAPGGQLLPSPVLGHQGVESGVKKEVKQLESLPAKAQPLVENKVDIPAKQLETKPEPKLEAKPKPSSVPVEAKKPEPKPETKKPEPKPTPKPEPKKKEPVANTAKPTVKKKEEPKKKAEVKPKVSPQDAIKAALADAKKQAKKEDFSRQSALAGALAEFKKDSSKGTGGGGGGEGDGPGGGGINDVYAGLVMMAIRANWSMPTFSRENLVAVVRIKLDKSGKILDSDIEKSSGRADFDASAVNAVIRTKNLPEPPTKEQQDLLLNFNSLELMGG